MPRLCFGSPWQQFKAIWQDCSLCPLCETRKNIVLCRGAIPCDVMFVGEAPGASEDVLGQPFVGPAGKLLDQQIAEALERTGAELRLCFTNLVCCIPKEGKGSKKVGEPSKESIQACEQRLKEFVNLCKPSLLVLVGDLSKKYIYGQAHFSLKPDADPDFGDLPWLNGKFLEFAWITHPAAILRAEIVRQALMYQKVVVVLENAFREL